MRAPVLLFTLLVATACYGYVPLSSPTPDVGTRVSARLTDAGSADLARFVGPGVGEIEGRVLSAGPDTLELSVVLVRLHSGIENFWKGEHVPVPRSQIAELRERKFARGRSVLSAGTLLLAAAAAIEVFNGGRGGSGRGGGPRPPPR